MNEPLISIAIEGAGRVHLPGDPLSGAFQIDAVEPDEIEAVELSVLWYTQGKGDEDVGVHHFERFTSDGGERGRLHELRPFRTTLPLSPLSYDGVILKIQWCVRVRVFLSKGREYVAETRFQLGNLPPAGLMAGRAPAEGTAVDGGRLGGDFTSGDAASGGDRFGGPSAVEALLSWNAPAGPVVIGPVRMRRVVAGRAISM
jgi:hypothetical protein